MREQLLLIIEGADYASALSRYLQDFYQFKVVTYNVESESFNKMLDNLSLSMFNLEPRVILTPGHLSARASGVINDAVFTRFEEIATMAEGRLIFAPGPSMPQPARMVELFARSMLPKRGLGMGDSLVSVLSWLAVTEGARSGG
jgi:hypothetical protein